MKTVQWYIPSITKIPQDVVFCNNRAADDFIKKCNTLAVKSGQVGWWKKFDNGHLNYKHESGVLGN